jgi:hypothetical protein
MMVFVHPIPLPLKRGMYFFKRGFSPLKNFVFAGDPVFAPLGHPCIPQTQPKLTNHPACVKVISTKPGIYRMIENIVSPGLYDTTFIFTERT